MNVVVDASVALAWLFQEKHSDQAREVEALVRQYGGVVPGLWYLEISNLLARKVCRGTIALTDAQQAIAHCSRLPIECDSQMEEGAFGETFKLACRHGLTAYDAAYLELALRRGLPLATLDDELRAAAVADGVAVVTA